MKKQTKEKVVDYAYKLVHAYHENEVNDKEFVKKMVNLLKFMRNVKGYKKIV